jgi:hypothetical protein
MTESSPLFHPPGVIRIVTPAEEPAIDRHTLSVVWETRRRAKHGSLSPIARTTRALCRVAHVWVKAQAHRGGL